MKFASAVAFLAVVAALAAIASSTKYDLIVAGAGSSGCEVAALVSANPKLKVLLLGEGDEQPERPYNAIPLVNPSDSEGVPTDYVRFAEPIFSIEGPANGKTSHATMRPFIWSGASKMNGGAFTFPDNKEFVRYAQLGITGWTQSKIDQYKKDIEQYIPFGGGPVPAGHGTNGPIQTRSIPPESRLNAFTKAMMYHTNTQFNNDTGLGNILGTGYYVRPLGGPAEVEATGNYSRQDSCKKFLYPHLHRKNLDIVMRAKVLKVDQDGACSKNGNAECVNRVTYQVNDEMFTAKIKKDGKIALAAGSLGSPKILLQSGIGPCDELQEGIDCLMNLPVGKNISDHMMFGQIYVTMPSPDWPSHRGSIVSTYKASTTSMNGDIDIQMSYTSYPAASGLQVILVMNVLTQPYSRGTLKQRTSDWNSPVNISFSVLNDNRDMPRLVEMFKYVRAAAANVSNFYPASKRDSMAAEWDMFADANPKMQKVVDCMKYAVNDPYFTSCDLDDLLGEEIDRAFPVAGTKRSGAAALVAAAGMTEIYPGAAVPAGASDAQIAAWVAPIAKPDYHTVGTAKMGVCSRGSVVNSRMQVCNVANLMVVDLSIQPEPFFGHSNHASAVLFGAVASGIILEDLA